MSSHSFNEDAFAGVMQAVEGMDWSGYGGRIILLVTDAGALRKNDPFAATQMNEAEVRQAALGKQIKIYALHPAHRRRQENPRRRRKPVPHPLTADANPQIGDLYTKVPGGDVRKLGERVDEIGTVFANLVHQVRNDTPQPLPLLSAAPSLADKSAAIGYAMHMDFPRAQSREPGAATGQRLDRRPRPDQPGAAGVPGVRDVDQIAAQRPAAVAETDRRRRPQNPDLAQRLLPGNRQRPRPI